MPDLVVEHIDVSRLGEEGDRAAAFKGGVLLAVRPAAGVVAAGDDLRGAELDAIGAASGNITFSTKHGSVIRASCRGTSSGRGKCSRSSTCQPPPCPGS